MVYVFPRDYLVPWPKYLPAVQACTSGMSVLGGFRYRWGSNFTAEGSRDISLRRLGLGFWDF